MEVSKSRLDIAGRSLARSEFSSDDAWLEAELLLDDYRAAHLTPLTETTAQLQQWLEARGDHYYLAQRLKRKPQILRKLARLSVRLSQLQDIGGLRVIVPDTRDVDALYRYIKARMVSSDDILEVGIKDYRERGRDRTGYRALHVILQRSGFKLELQVRSQIQHAWAENIERTSVVYGYHLKEEEGDPAVLAYFRLLSDAFYDIENGRRVDAADRLRIDRQRDLAQDVLSASTRSGLIGRSSGDDVVKAIGSSHVASGGIFNWILVFDWNSGSFVHWELAPRSPRDAVSAYVRSERQFPQEDGFEVVLAGASEPETLRQTHTHYFGLAELDEVLQSLDSEVDRLDARLGLGLDERAVLIALHRRHKWGAGRVSRDTIRNVYCPDIVDLDRVLASLVAQGLLSTKGGYSLNQKEKGRIEALL